MKIMFVTEQRQGKWNNTSFETLAAAQQIAADASNIVSGLVIGKSVAARVSTFPSTLRKRRVVTGSSQWTDSILCGCTSAAGR